MSAVVLHVIAGAARSPFKKTPGAEAKLASPRLVRKGVELHAGKLASYARICGYDRAAPVPLPYPHLLGFPLATRIMAARDFPLPLLGLVHTGIEITQRRALSPAERVDVTVYAAGLREHRRGTEVEMVTEVCADDGPVWDSRSTYLALDRSGNSRSNADGEGEGNADGVQITGDGGPPGPGPGPCPGPGPGRESRAATAAPGAQWSLREDLGRRYGRVSGDLNPIHLHPLPARLFGFRRAIAHGMWTFARCVAAAGTSEVAHVQAEFKAPVLLPARVSFVRTGGGGFELRGADGRLHLRGSASAPVA